MLKRIGEKRNLMKMLKNTKKSWIGLTQKRMFQGRFQENREGRRGRINNSRDIE